MLEQENYADKELVVGSLKVLGNVSGRESEKVRQNLEMLQNTVKSQQARQDNYWNSLTADGVISAVEKKQLKKEFEGIEQTHTALMKQASDKGILDSGEIDKYNEAFTDLKEYLFTKLQLFKRMTEKTEIESAEIFNKYYSDYYFALQNAQARVTIGEPGKIRVLSSLTEPGTNEEVALYENNFYRYDLQNHEWIGISVASKLGEYMGVRTDSPPQVLNQYFLVGKGGITGDFLEFIPESRASIDNAWTDENGNIIFINYGFEEGYIYFWNDRNEFEKVEDRNNWRYIIALNDLRANGFEVSPELYEWLTIDIAKEIETSIQDKVYEKAPKYERVKRLPENPNNGDWILWDAASTSRFTKGHVYLYQKATVEWIELDPKDESGAVRSKLMAALTDILEVNQADTVGYFSTVFASAFFSNTATIKSLATRTIEIEADGMINSRGYVRGQSGWFIKGNGEAQFGKVEISQDGNVRIYNGYFSGNVEATSGTFRGTLYASGFNCLINAGEAYSIFNLTGGYSVYFGSLGTSDTNVTYRRRFVIFGSGSIRIRAIITGINQHYDEQYAGEFSETHCACQTYFRLIKTNGEQILIESYQDYIRVNNGSFNTGFTKDVTVSTGDIIEIQTSRARIHDPSRPVVGTKKYYDLLSFNMTVYILVGAQNELAKYLSSLSFTEERS